MVTSVNGNRGSSVIPIDGDDWMFLGRGRHVWLDNQDVHMNGSSGILLAEGVTASGTTKIAQINSVGGTMKAMLLKELDSPEDYLLCCNSGWHF